MFEPIIPKFTRRTFAYNTAQSFSAGTCVKLVSGTLNLATDAAQTLYWVWTEDDRQDVIASGQLTVVQGPVTAEVDTDAYTGNPVEGDWLTVDGGTPGKLAVVDCSGTWPPEGTHPVAQVEVAPDADGVMTIRIFE